MSLIPSFRVLTVTVLFFAISGFAAVASAQPKRNDGKYGLTCEELLALANGLTSPDTESQAGEQGSAGKTLSDPVYLADGDYQLKEQDIYLPGRGLSLEFSRFYRSRLHYSWIAASPIASDDWYMHPMGINWDHNYNMFFEISGNVINFYNGSGRFDKYDLDPLAGRATAKEHFGVIEFTGVNAPAYFHAADNTVYEFEYFSRPSVYEAMRLKSITDRNGNRITISYETDSDTLWDRIASVQDDLGNTLTFDYYNHPNAVRPSTPTEGAWYANLIWKVTDQTGRSVEYKYDFDFSTSIGRYELTEVILPAIKDDPGVIDLPAEHERFSNGRSKKYEYDHPGTNSNYLGLLARAIDPNGDVYLENSYSYPFGSDGEYRRIEKQVYGGSTYTYTLTDLDGRAAVTGSPGIDTENSGFVVWIKTRNNNISKLVYSAQDDPNGGYRLKSRTDYPGVVPVGLEDKHIWYDSRAGEQTWKYRDESADDNVLTFGGLVNKKRSSDQPTTRSFEFNEDWKLTSITHPNGDKVNMLVDDTSVDPRSRGVVSSVSIDPFDPLDPTSTIVRSWEHEFALVPDLDSSGCGCGSGGFPSAMVDGNGNRTEYEYDPGDFNAVPPVSSTGNLEKIYHAIPAVHANGSNPRSYAAAVEEFEYDTGGNITKHIHPTTTRLVNGVPVSYSRVDEFVYYDDYHPNVASRGKLQIARTVMPVQSIETTFEYDAIGNVSKVIEPDGDVKDYLYNQARQLVRERHWDATESTLYAQTDYFYDANGNLVIEEEVNLDEIQDPVVGNDTITTVYEYDVLNFLTRVSREREVFSGTVAELSDGSRRAIAPKNSDWVTTEWEYDSNKNITLFRDGEAAKTGSTQPENVVSYEYDYRNLLYREVRGLGSSTELVQQFNYDANGRMTESIVNPDSPGGNETQIITMSYNAYDSKTSVTDPMGNVASFEYDKNQNQTKIEVLGPVVEDTDESVTIDTAVLLYKKELEYDSRNLLKEEEVSVFNYLSGSQSVVDLQTTTYTYNEDSSLSLIESPSGESGVIHTAGYFYDTAGRTHIIVDGAGNTIEYTYDVDSNVSRVDQYDQSSADPIEQQFVTNYNYDALDRLITRTDGALNQTQWRYDSRFNRTLEIDGKGNATAYDYDGLNRLVATRVRMTADGDGPEDDPVLDSVNDEIETVIIYDDSSRVVAEIDDNGHQTDYEYDAVNRRTKIMLPGGSPTRDTYTTEYNGNGMAVTVTDARGVILKQSFDLNNRLEYRYVDDQPMGAVVPDGALREEFIYDGLGRILTATNFEDSAGSIELTKVSRAYDSRSHVLRETQNVDGANDFPTGMDRVVNYEFDLANNPTRIQYPHGRDIHRGYDSINRLVSIADHEPTTPMAITDFDYIGRRLDRRVNGNDTETSYTYSGYELAPVNANDKNFGRVVGITTTDSSSSAVLDDFEFTWDASQNRSSYDDVGSGMKNRRERAFSYDSSDRLVSTDVDFPDVNTDYTSPTNSGITDYDLDGVHNRFSVAGFEDAGSPIGDYKDVAIDDAEHVKNNQYTYTAHENGGSWINTYDANGNLTFRTEHNVADFTGDYQLDFLDTQAFLTAHGNQDPDADLNGDGVCDFYDISLFLGVFVTDTQLDHQYFTYDFRNQLIKIELKSGASTPVTVTNTYDAFARRVVESVGESPDVVSMQFVYGCASLWEVIEQIQLETTTALEYVWSTHVYGLGIDDEVSYRMESSAEDFWSHRDDLNSLTSVSNHLGEIKERYEYGDFGKPRMFDPATGEERVISDVGVVHLYTGRSLIMGTGLFDYRHRVMDPETGRFRQRDPLGAIDGPSLYTYVSNTPMTMRDPSGLIGVQDWGVGSGHNSINEPDVRETEIDSGAQAGGIMIATGLLIMELIPDDDGVELTAWGMLRQNLFGRVRGSSSALRGPKSVSRAKAAKKADPCPTAVVKCFVSGTLVHTDSGEVPIESVSVGESLASSPDGLTADDDTASQSNTLDPDSWNQVIPDEWSLIEMRCDYGDGRYTNISALRPNLWVAGFEVGDRLEYFGDSAEGIAGDIEILSFSPCPELPQDSTGVVRATYETHGVRVLDLWLAGADEPIGVTANHPLYSLDRQAWVDVGELWIGEQLQTFSGENVAVERIGLREGEHVVYNYEVHGDRTYFVGELGVWAHNGGGRDEFRKVREQFWKDEASNYTPGSSGHTGTGYTDSDLDRMKNGKPPIGNDGHPMELHHKESLKNGGSNDLDNLEPKTRTDHRLGENYSKNHPKCP